MSSSDGQQTTHNDAVVPERAIERWENEGGKLLVDSPKPRHSADMLNHDAVVVNRQSVNPRASSSE